MTPEQIIEMAKQAGLGRETPDDYFTIVWSANPTSLKRFAQLVWNAALEAALKPGDGLDAAFREGVLHAAKKYAAVREQRFTGGDVALFLEMEAAEVDTGYTAAPPAQTPAKDMRSQFESWAKSYSTLSIDRDLGGAYVDMNQEMLWHAFQAGVKA